MAIGFQGNLADGEQLAYNQGREMIFIIHFLMQHSFRFLNKKSWIGKLKFAKPILMNKASQIRVKFFLLHSLSPVLLPIDCHVVDL